MLYNVRFTKWLFSAHFVLQNGLFTIYSIDVVQILYNILIKKQLQLGFKYISLRVDKSSAQEVPIYKYTEKFTLNSI